ncbi:hypothetical protein AAMO2058_000612800 [Amorphochlora amoebiformis]
MVVSLWVLALYVVALHARRPVHFNSSSVEKLSQSKQNSSEKAESTGHLSLLEATQTSFHASYKSLAFRASIISEKEAKSALYTVPSNENLFRLETTPSGKIFQFLDKPEIIVNTSMAGSLDSHTDKLYPLIQEYSSRPEMAHIRLLSKSLGEQGMDGSKYPIALWLHRLAAASPKPSVEHGSEEASFLERRTKGAAQIDSFQKALSGKSFLLNKKKAPSLVYTGEYTTVPCSRCGNPCFGLCGQGCDCWDWVCGDCETHQGCWEHDCYCSCRGLTNSRCVQLMAHVNTCNDILCARKYCSQDPKVIHTSC